MELPGRLSTALAAANSGDGRAFAACFTPRTGVVNDWGATFRGSDAIHAWCAERFIDRGAQIELVHVYRTEEGDVMVIATITDEGTAAACSFLVSLKDDGAIATMRVIG
ncbi:nuclear transport factor 2 family protein [Mycolicibacterium sphagni]|uniref:nuclear transport factor 2 family protein n=1 Tax=Mycolicibacterium sphagni TaxID=1786 RepID=UPI002351EE52|nr:nuclear transport factor 2 family protein [Mycolicibacterium sphagni]